MNRFKTHPLIRFFHGLLILLAVLSFFILALGTFAKAYDRKNIHEAAKVIIDGGIVGK